MTYDCRPGIWLGWREPTRREFRRGYSVIRRLAVVHGYLVLFRWNLELCLDGIDDSKTALKPVTP